MAAANEIMAATDLIWVGEDQPVFEKHMFYFRHEVNGVRYYRCASAMHNYIMI